MLVVSVARKNGKTKEIKIAAGRGNFASDKPQDEYISRNGMRWTVKG